MPTEKTTLGFHSKKPFVVLGQKHTLKELKRKGYKTFHPFINESYDDIDNNDNRFFQVIKEFEKLLLLSEDDFLKFVDNTKKITEHHSLSDLSNLAAFFNDTSYNFKLNIYKSFNESDYYKFQLMVRNAKLIYFLGL